MLYRGIIIEIKENYSIVMTDDSQFLRIKNKDGMQVGAKIFFLEDDLYTEKVAGFAFVNNESDDYDKEEKVINFQEKKEGRRVKKNKTSLYKRFVSVAAAIAIIVGTVIYTSAPKSYAKVSFDENGSSVELELDKNKNINSTSIINGDLDISDDEDFTKVLDQLYKQIKEDAKKNQNGRVLVALCFEGEEDSNYEKEIRELISKKFKGLNIMYIKVDKSQIEQNKNTQISMGEYAAMKMIEEDDIEGMTIDRLNKMLKDKKYAYLREEILDELEDRTEEFDDDDDDDIDDIEECYRKSNKKKNKVINKYDDNDDQRNDDDDDDRVENSSDDSDNDDNSEPNNDDSSDDTNDSDNDSDDNNEEDND